MAKVQLIGDKAMNRVVSHIGGVKDAVHDEAKDGARRSEAILEAERSSTRWEKISGPEHVTEITVTRGDTDSFVNLEATNPLAIEFGHSPSGFFDPDRYGRVTKAPEGLYILSRGTGLV